MRREWIEGVHAGATGRFRRLRRQPQGDLAGGYPPGRQRTRQAGGKGAGSDQKERCRRLPPLQQGGMGPATPKPVMGVSMRVRCHDLYIPSDSTCSFY